MRTELIKLKNQLHRCLDQCEPAKFKLEMNQTLNGLEGLVENVIEKGHSITIQQFQTVNFNFVKTLNAAIQQIDKMIQHSSNPNAQYRETEEHNYLALEPMMLDAMEYGISLKQFKNDMEKFYIQCAVRNSKTRTEATRLLQTTRGTLVNHIGRK